MKAYLEITLIPSPEIPQHFLLEKLFEKLHLAFVEIKNPDGTVPIGISFPEYKTKEGSHPLGSKMRLFAQIEAVLQNPKLKNRLEQLSDYIHVTSVRSVPDKILGYSCYKRQQVHSSNDRLARRRAKRQNISLSEAQNHFTTRNEDKNNLPFIYLNSASTQQKRFRLFIERVSVEKEIQGDFTTYGLSSGATLPEF